MYIMCRENLGRWTSHAELLRHQYELKLTILQKLDSNILQ